MSMHTCTSGRNILTSALLAVTMSVAIAADGASQAPADSPPKPTNRVAIRGCLTGTKLTHLVPQSSMSLELPDTLRVTSIRVIRDQVKALNGHEVEVIGTLRALPGLENGILVVDGERGKFYIGGGDPRLGPDLVPANVESPRIHADTIRNIAETCAATPD